jgi:hypothetical protein
MLMDTAIRDVPGLCLRSPGWLRCGVPARVRGCVTPVALHDRTSRLREGGPDPL